MREWGQRDPSARRRRHRSTRTGPRARNGSLDVLARYRDFFAAFDDFRGYVDFWLLQDMVTGDYAAVRFFMPFDEFRPPSIPYDVESYREYRQRSIEFIQARNRRIDRLGIGS